jgi:hypothetical protein
MNKNRLVKKKVVKKEKPELLIYNKNIKTCSKIICYFVKIGINRGFPPA